MQIQRHDFRIDIVPYFGKLFIGNGQELLCPFGHGLIAHRIIAPQI